jgi:hypothetical protein
MQDENASGIVTFQRVLDKGFQLCLAEAQRMHEQVGQPSYKGKLEQSYSDVEHLRRLVSPSINKLYETMARTIFEVLAIMQPEDFQHGDVNLYLLPGYHSCLTDRRLFYSKPIDTSATQNLGVGLSGNPLTSRRGIDMYHDCCQARWYTFATTPPQERDFRPGSPYFWFAHQRPTCSDSPHDLIASFTFSTAAQNREPHECLEHKTVQLDSRESSHKWGSQVADLLNSIRHKRYPEWVFPDRYDRRNDPRYDAARQTRLRQARCLLISLWMHSVFENERPKWWNMLLDELQRQQLTSVINSLLTADADPIASNWGDKGEGRPQFNTWTTVSMHQLAAPPPMPLVEQRDAVNSNSLDSDTYLQTVGWATMLSSVPLGLPFLSVVRPWIRMVYGMLRSAEVHVLLKDRLPLHQAAQAVRFISHDMYKFTQESVTTVINAAERTDKKTVDYRRFVLQLLKAHGELAYAVCSAATDEAKVIALKHEILQSLSQLEDDHLITCLYQVATDVQSFRKEKKGGTFSPTLAEARRTTIPFDTYVSCLLLVGEIIRNQCQHGKGSVAELTIKKDDGNCLVIQLEVNGERKAGHSFYLLNNALKTLRLGSAKFNKAGSSNDKSRWIITINMSEVEESQ